MSWVFKNIRHVDLTFRWWNLKFLWKLWIFLPSNMTCQKKIKSMNKLKFSYSSCIRAKIIIDLLHKHHLYILRVSINVLFTWILLLIRFHLFGFLKQSMLRWVVYKHFFFIFMKAKLSKIKRSTISVQHGVCSCCAFPWWRGPSTYWCFCFF